MLTKGKRRVAALVLMVAIMATMLAGYASAAESATYATSYSFWISCPGAGGTDTATPREKESSLRYAYYYLSTVTNNTGYNAYINVRNNDTGYRAGTAATVTGTGSYNVNYFSDDGFVGTYYYPSGQSSSSSSSSKAVYIEGTWRP